MWIETVAVNITLAEKSWIGTWKIEGNYIGGNFVGGISEIIGNACAAVNAEVLYELANAEGVQQDKLNGGKWLAVSGNTFGKSGMTTLNSSSYGGARGKLNFTINSLDGVKTVSFEAAAHKSK